MLKTFYYIYYQNVLSALKHDKLSEQCMAVVLSSHNFYIFI